ncbi:Rep family protein [Lactococcus lactis]|uniref:Rep family protein n=1 Tax=Lactococcus lactis TaxID=1358 RepID=UPI001F52B802|nr:Rep family protein [Lactococcus lactis]MCI1071882.1 replication protein [Lactococcus lactis]
MKRIEKAREWTCIVYEEHSKNIIEVLNSLAIPWLLSPLHNKDVSIDDETGEVKVKKPHYHLVLSYGRTVSREQVSSLVSEKLNSPKHVEPVRSRKGLYQYLTHAENPEKAQYNISDIQSGSGFDIENFLKIDKKEEDKDALIQKLYQLIFEEEYFSEYVDLTFFLHENLPELLPILQRSAWHFAKIIDSKRYKEQKNCLPATLDGAGNSLDNKSSEVSNSDDNSILTENKEVGAHD